jgi:RNA polymerase sigma-70 factor (ECF subfamily)
MIERPLLEPTDRELAMRIAIGDEAAFALAYDRHAGLVFGSACRFLGDRDVAAEVTQDAFLALWRRAAVFDPASGSLSAWLLGIARHRAIDRHRAEGRRGGGRTFPLSLLRREDADDGGSDASLAGAAGLAGLAPPVAPIDEAERRWVRAVVRTMVSELPDHEREVVALAYADGLAQSEIAERLELPIGTVKSRTRRALVRLRARLVAIPGLVPDPTLPSPQPSTPDGGR